MAESDNQRPVILLDVDGVLNIYPDEPKDTWEDWCDKPCAWVIIRYSLEMGTRLKALDADIVWLTTWEQDDMANKWIAPLFGWEDLPILYAGKEWFRRGWWKSILAEQFIMNNPRPFIWIDDDLNYSIENEEVDWVMRANDQGIQSLLISPLLSKGLLPSHIDQIEAFLEQFKERSDNG